jgi:hypothetical protein
MKPTLVTCGTAEGHKRRFAAPIAGRQRGQAATEAGERKAA